MPRLIVRVAPAGSAVAPGSDSVAELNRPRITIGRSARNDLCLEDPFASRLHAEVRKKGFRVWIIPHTFAVTALRERKTGDAVNLEADLLGKYVRHFLTSSRA